MNEDVYESLLLYKVELEKECLAIEREYYLVFGEPLLKLLKLKLSCAEAKQKIAYCQRMRNQGLEPSEEEMQRYAKENCMDAYLEFLSASRKKNHAERCMDLPSLDPESIERLKKLFRALMKMVHPDIHPEWQKDPLASSLYEHALIAYKDNDIHKMVELYDLASMHFEEDEMEIDHLEEKIAALKEEIHEIESNNPYLYRAYLDDPDKGKELLDSLAKQTKEYESFQKELEDRLFSLLNKKVGQA